MLINEGSVPPQFKTEAEKINQAAVVLQAAVAAVQKACIHEWKKVMTYDRNYCDRVDGLGRGQEVIKEFHCPLCNLRQPLKGAPDQICYKCGGKMKYDHRELCGMDRVHIHKCQDCGHEYDTT